MELATGASDGNNAPGFPVWLHLDEEGITAGMGYRRHLRAAVPGNYYYPRSFQPSIEHGHTGLDYGNLTLFR